MNLISKLRYFLRFNPIFRPYWRYLGPHAQWRLDRAKVKRFRTFCKERGITIKKKQ